MSSAHAIDFSTLQSVISTQDVIAHASDIHGFLTGLISAGYDFEQSTYLSLLSDAFNNGQAFSATLTTSLQSLYSDIWQKLLDDSYGFALLLPEDDESLAQRSAGLGHWVQGFNLGFGMQHQKTDIASDEVKEVIADFAEIANLSTEVDEDEEGEQAFFEIEEYVRISSLLIFTELGSAPEQKSPNKTLH
ncbi:UPF0149 family protein [Thalassotalea eurytherma]|uniref:YecA family protein n=1 Tax=Thalassotalea eurytherma TaxID=1144278 RepID=A0ABQ6GZX7_9GAMM|nr:UPF0149 family protein [Thalassotalea eurytherma]GLX81491.1 hypothetical protein theurythT_09430 [Thalassotalea eurytherma]